jgi:NADH-quinone oxidoreductase subunit G
LLGRTASGDVAAAYLVGGDPAGWITEKQAAALEAVETLVVQDMFPSPASQRAMFVLPGGSFAERDGTFVNHAGLAQEIRRSIRGPGDAHPDGRILWDLAERRGLFQTASLRCEMSRKVPQLAALEDGELGEQGTFLHAQGAGTTVEATRGGI